MTAALQTLLAQNIGEYGAFAGLGSFINSAAAEAEILLSEPRTAVPIGLIVLVLAYFLLRRR